MVRIIIVEGLDNTGKTHLISQLLEHYPQLHYRPSIGNKHDPVEIKRQAEDEATHHRPYTISDRSRLISEYVYTPVLQNRDLAYPMSEWLRMLGLFVQRTHLIIWATRSLEEIHESFSHREQLSGVADNLWLLSVRYKQLFSMMEFLFTVDGQDPVKRIQPWGFKMGIEGPIEWVKQYLSEVED